MRVPQISTFILFFYCVLLGNKLFAQALEVFPLSPPYVIEGNTLSGEEYLAYVLLGSEQLEISNVSLNCDAEAFGLFETHPDNPNPEGFDLTEGIALTTGALSDLPGPNSGIISTANGTPGDSDLASWAGVNIQDACVLEMDVKALGTAFSFDYVFGSEEYDSYVCSQFNDAFAFFITGPNPNGGLYFNQNIALIPGTDKPVSISTVNDGVNDGGGGPICELDYTEFYAGELPELEFEGLTVKLTAFVEVIPCETYHLKIVIGDGTDNALDSGVMLQAGSMQAEPVFILEDEGGDVEAFLVDENGLPVLDEAGVPIPAHMGQDDEKEDIMVENCGTKMIKFGVAALDKPCKLNLEITGTATNGVDYTDLDGNPFPSEITLTPDENQKDIELLTLADSEEEGLETIVIKVVGIDDNVCSDDAAFIRFDTIRLIDKVENYIANVVPNEGTGPFDQGAITQVTAYVAGGGEVEWIPNEYFAAPNEASTSVTLEPNVEYAAIIKSACLTDTLPLPTFDIVEDTISSLYQLGINEKVFVYPNPVQDYLIIESIEGIQEIQIFDASGEIVWNGNTPKLNLSHLKNGMYFVQIKTAQGTTYKKILKE